MIVENPSDAHIIAEREFETAGKRIIAGTDVHGGQERAAVAWLLSFLASDTDTLSTGQQDELWGTVCRFCYDAGQGRGTTLGRLGGVQYRFPENRAERTRLVAHIQRETRAVLESYLKTGRGVFPKGEGAFSLRRGFWLVAGDHPLRYSGGDLPSCFYSMAAHLIAKYGLRLKQCKGCPLLMLVGRKDKRYHSQTCQVGSFVKRKRAKEKAQRLAREQRKQMKARQRKAVKKTVNGKKLKRKKGGKHGTKR